jgi:hypothetical protein
MKTLLAAAQACANIAFIKFTLAKLGLTNRKICFDGKYILSSSFFFSHNSCNANGVKPKREYIFLIRYYDK